MAKRTSTTRSRRRAGRKQSASSGSTFAHRDRWIAACLLLAAVITALIFLPSLRRLADQSKPVHEVRFHGAPTWAGDTLLRHLAETALGATGEDAPAHDRSCLCRVRDALDDTGWFATVDQVRRDADGALVVEATFLAPRAIVEDRYGEAIVDGKGRLLPEGCRLDPAAHVVRLTHPRIHRPVRARRAWESDDVHAALALLDRIDQRDWIDQIRSIDLSGHARHGRLVLQTDRDSRIVWGSAPGEETPLEALWERKLVRLDHLFSSSGRVDQHHAGEIDLTDASVVVRR